MRPIKVLIKKYCRIFFTGTLFTLVQAMLGKESVALQEIFMMQARMCGFL